MALKGTTTIELTNADGSKEVYKHDNMITNAPKDLLKSYRGEMPPIFKVADWRGYYANLLFGGMILFNDTLNDDPDDYFIPSVNVTGYASRSAYSGADTAMGGCNVNETGLQEDGSYKFVWDFATSQGNGQIKSIALCNTFMARIGMTETLDTNSSFYGSDSERINKSPVAPFDTSGTMLYSSNYTIGISNYNFVPVAVYDGYVYAVDRDNCIYNPSNLSVHLLKNGGVLNFYRFRCGLDSVSVKDVVCGGTYVDTVSVTLPSSFVSGLATTSNSYSVAIEYDYATKKVRVFYCALKSTFNPNASVPYVEVDLSDMSVKSYTFTNNTSVTISSYTYSSISNRCYPFYVCNDYIVSQGVSGSSRKLFVTKRSDNTDVKEVKYSNTHEFKFASNYCFMPHFVNGKILVFKTYYQPQVVARWFVLDMETGIVKATNFTEYGAINTVDFGSKVCYGNAGNYLGFSTVLNPFVLSTKNNFDTPIIKTASQTMKITYTLTESEV